MESTGLLPWPVISIGFATIFQAVLQIILPLWYDRFPALLYTSPPLALVIFILSILYIVWHLASLDQEQLEVLLVSPNCYVSFTLTQSSCLAADFRLVRPQLLESCQK
ncbi:hypothetical protein F4808DRAFT_444601 [Astrocystis sublimbata]|nr:hypothetical protein F4808DRAFT_444601 [Astrocystis sublimbata]